MDDQTDGDLTLSIVEGDDLKPLSPIVEMDESTGIPDEEFVVDSKDDSNKYCKVDAKLNLDTSAENVDYESRLLQPETPPEVLRVRLNSLQSEFEELKEFTDLEKQVYHSDCVPREKVRSLEEDFAALNAKVQHLMQENSDYKRKLDIKDNENKRLKLEVEKALTVQNESMVAIGHMKQKLQENIKDACPIKEVELLPPFSFLDKCGTKTEVSYFQHVEPFLGSLRELDDFLSNEKNEWQSKVEDLESQVFELNETIESMNEDIIVYKNNLTLVKTINANLQKKLANIEEELTEISMAFSTSENKRSEAELAKDVAIDELSFYQNEMEDTREQVISIMSTLKSFVHSLYDDSDVKISFVTYEDLTELENNLRNSRNLLGISSTLAILERIFNKLKREVKLKHEECYDLQLNIKQLNGHVSKYEEDISRQKAVLESLELEVKQEIPSRLLGLENCLLIKDSENVKLKHSLETANANIVELSNKLSESTRKVNEMEILLLENSVEKGNLENKILKLNNQLTIDNIQTHIILAVKCLECVVDSWDAKSNLGNLVHAFQEMEDTPHVTDLLMDVTTQAIFNEVAMKYKEKLLLHDEETNNLCSVMKTARSHIDLLESENEQLRIEVNALDHIVREGISNRVSDLEILICCRDQEKMADDCTKKYTYFKDKDNSRFSSDGEKQNGDSNLLNAINNGCDKLKKEMSNLNKATKPDDFIEKVLCDLNEIENLIDSWDLIDSSSGKIKVSEFTQHLCEKILKYCDNHQNSKIQVDMFRIVNKFEMKLTELLELNNQLLKTEKSSNNFIEEHENKQELYKCTIEDLQWMTNALKEKKVSEIKKVNEDFEKEYKHNAEKDIKTIKKLMCLEITSLDETEDEGSLLCDTVECIFSKLMQIIMKKQQEMSYSIQKQQKEENHNFEKTIEKLNNKLKSQESWTKTLENENERINNELVALKSLNNSYDHKLKNLSNDINNKTFEIDIMKRKVLDLMTENDSLVSDLDATKDLINNYRLSINSLEKDIEKLNEDIVNKSNVIKSLEFKLTPVFDKLEHLNSNITSSPNSSSLNAIGDSLMVGVQNSNFGSVIIKDCPDGAEEQKEKRSDFESGLSDILKKETAFINDMLTKTGRNIAFSELFSRCHENVNVLKDLIQNIGSKISELEISHAKDLQSIQTAFEYKTKEMCDFKLSISKLYWDLVPQEVQLRKREMIYERFQQSSTSTIQHELDEIKSECVSVKNRAEELEKSAREGQNIVQNLRETIQTIVDENNNMAKLVFDLRKSIECEQEKTVEEKQRADTITNEKQVLLAKTSMLENEIRDLKSELSQLKREIFSEIDISFPDKMEDGDKVTYIKNTLKQYSEAQEVCYTVTEDLRFFGYHCELMLSYIQSLEYKLYFTTQKKEHLEKENTALKGQITTLNFETNRFLNQLISKSPYIITSHSQALEVISHIFSEYKLLKKNEAKRVNEDKLKHEEISQLQKELNSMTKQNSSLKFELSRCEDSIRNMRSELRSVRPKCQRRESISTDLTEVKQEKTDAKVQTEGSCCNQLQKKITEQKDKLDILTAKLMKAEQLQQLSKTSSPYKQVSYLEAALGQAKEKIGRLHFALKQKESHNQELVEALKRHESCQHRLDEAKTETENLMSDRWPSK